MRTQTLVAALLFAVPLTAQQAPTPAVQPPVAPGAYRVLSPAKLYPGVTPGSEGWTIPESTDGQAPGRIVRNVVSPEYVPYLPDASRNTGTGVIIAPGGGMVMLSYDSEGVEVAKWLAERGIAAVKVIRARAADYGVTPDKIVMVGFSAGAIVTSLTALHKDPTARPDYAAPIYGGSLGGVPDVPQGLPPFFLAVAQDDGAASLVDRLYAALLAAGYKPELHRFQSGGHGFGMGKRFTTSDHWIDEFFWWMEANGLTRKPGDPERPNRTTPRKLPGSGRPN